MLPTDPAQRKSVPLARGLVDYFPDALAAVAALSVAGNTQHHAEQAIHWDRAKSSDHDDCLLRHFFDRGTIDTDGQRHSAKVAWRALALLQEELESDLGVPLPRNARLPQEPATPPEPAEVLRERLESVDDDSSDVAA